VGFGEGKRKDIDWGPEFTNPSGVVQKAKKNVLTLRGQRWLRDEGQRYTGGGGGGLLKGSGGKKSLNSPNDSNRGGGHQRVSHWQQNQKTGTRGREDREGN